MAAANETKPAPNPDRRNTRLTIYGILVHQILLSRYYYCISMSPVSFRHHIVTGFDLIPDGTCHAKHRHLPLFSNRIIKLGAPVKLPIRE